MLITGSKAPITWICGPWERPERLWRHLLCRSDDDSGSGDGEASVGRGGLLRSEGGDDLGTSRCPHRSSGDRIWCPSPGDCILRLVASSEIYAAGSEKPRDIDGCKEDKGRRSADASHWFPPDLRNISGPCIGSVTRLLHARH